MKSLSCNSQSHNQGLHTSRVIVCLQSTCHMLSFLCLLKWNFLDHDKVLIFSTRELPTLIDLISRSVKSVNKKKLKLWSNENVEEEAKSSLAKETGLNCKKTCNKTLFERFFHDGLSLPLVTKSFVTMCRSRNYCSKFILRT